jgi:hypothetical protein
MGDLDNLAFSTGDQLLSRYSLDQLSFGAKSCRGTHRLGKFANQCLREVPPLRAEAAGETVSRRVAESKAAANCHKASIPDHHNTVTANRR